MMSSCLQGELSLDIEFQWSNLQLFEEKLNLTSPKLPEFYRKL